ncbi:MAG: twin-arginine translocase TatA/TatE family subunit [Acidobacteriota bacterium]|nr:twin-arginine translocase TatA/TatE family subunit [Acidobacteriota bacterium]MDQ5839350.1 twin-arginine translocase TatA/TatE family subunit [Acidobacteriota bacterium]
MSHIFLLGGLNPMEWVIIIGVIILLFGSSKLPQLAKSLAQSKRAFREGLEEDEKEQAARREKQLNASTQTQEPRGSLADVDDEALFEEARRRAAQKRAEESKQS